MIFILQLFIMKKFNSVFGIDVSKDVLDIFDSSTSKYSQISNTKNSILKWIKKVNPKKALCVFEPTGSYSSQLLHLLSEKNIALSLVNPARSSDFTKAQGIISKNDKQAAKTLALMGQILELPLFKKTDNAMYERKQLIMGINALKKQRQMLKNQLHALAHQVLFVPQVETALKETLNTVEQNLELLEEQLNDLTDEEHHLQFELITSVVGIGSKTANLILVATGGVQNFERPRQLSKFLGIVPYSHESGSSIKIKGRITKKGNATLRASLYMAARSAIRYNHACKELYERLRAKGKPYKKAIVAVMNKLVKQVFGVVNANKEFDNQYYLNFKNS